MSIDYDEIRGEAAEALEEAGALMYLRVVTGGVVDHTGAASAKATINYPVHGLNRFYKTSELDGKRILKSDRKILITAPEGMPEPTPKKDKLAVDGEVWGIEACEPLKPGPTTIIYKIQARKP